MHYFKAQQQVNILVKSELAYLYPFQNGGYFLFKLKFTEYPALVKPQDIFFFWFNILTRIETTITLICYMSVLKTK